MTTKFKYNTEPECHYHSCKKNSGPKKCKYCSNYFCGKHIKPTPSGLPRFKGASPEDKEFMKEWREEGGHPCPEYFIHWETKKAKAKEKLDEEYWKTLDRMKRLKPTKIEEEEPEEELIHNKVSTEQIIHHPHYTVSRSNFIGNNFWMILIILLFISGAIYSLSQYVNLDVDNLEKEVHSVVNKVRENHGLPPLQWDEELAEIARAHSEDMAQRDFFSHVNPDGLDSSERAALQDYSCYKDYGSYYTIGIAENIFYSSDGIDGVRNVVTEWMNSPGHRENVLERSYDKEGIGIAISYNYVYVTQDFC